MHGYFDFDFLNSVQVFDIRLWGTNLDETYFRQQAKIVCENFPMSNDNCGVISGEIFVLIGVLQERSLFLSDIGDKAKSPPSSFWPAVLHQSDLQISQETREFLSLPLVRSDSSAECERGFSFMNRITQDSRGSLTERKVDSVLRVKLNGNKPVDDINYFKYAKEFVHRDHHVPVDAVHGARKRKFASDEYQKRVSRLF